MTEESLFENPKKMSIPKYLEIFFATCFINIHINSIPVDPAGPDCYLGEDKPCELNGIPKFPMANCSVTHDQLTL